MAWFKKKDNIPHLTDAPRLPEIPTLNSIQMDQSIPLPPNQNQDTIKYALSSSEKKKVILEDAPKAIDMSQSGDMIPSIQDYDIPEITTTKITKTTISESTPSPRVSKEPVFIKIDKYEAAIKDMEDIKKSLKDIESTLEKVKDVKLKEDLEITGWSQEIANVKGKVNNIESRIFNQI